MSIEQELAPLVKTVVVPTTPERAFRLFTEELGKWWPLATHSVRGDHATDVRLESAVGGQIVEYDASGPVGSWGTVSDWDPPRTVSFSWHPGSNPQEAGHVTVRFTAIDETGPGSGADGEVGGGSGNGDGEVGDGGSAHGSSARGDGVGDGEAQHGSGTHGEDSGRGSTLVELTHIGWERRPDGARARENYDSGWSFVLRQFQQFRR